MTRKEEIREAALDQRSGLLPVDDAQMIELIDFILELTAPESSPGPLESQEELWIEASKVFQKFYFEGIKAIECQKELESLFILTRRTEEKGRTEEDLLK